MQDCVLIECNKWQDYAEVWGQLPRTVRWQVHDAMLHAVVVDVGDDLVTPLYQTLS